MKLGVWWLVRGRGWVDASGTLGGEEERRMKEEVLYHKACRNRIRKKHLKFLKHLKHLMLMVRLFTNYIYNTIYEYNS